ncbi:MAG: HAD family phosphatase [Chloroflexi bacterium]|nr:HAD family phosphatase [Chloroflexota bacterium]
MSVCEAVIFDLDGVLVDSEIWWDEVRQAFARDHGRPWTLEDRASVMGANSRQWSATMAERLHLALAPVEIKRTIVERMVERWRNAPLIPTIRHADEVVRRLAKRWPLGLASSAHRDVIEAALAATELEGAFRTVVSSDEVARGKPAPDVYLEAARRLAVDPARCVVVEDSLNGVLAGKAAGMTVVLVPNASIPPAPGASEAADVVLESIDQLDPEALASRAGAPG